MALAETGVANEQVKAVSTFFLNLSVALTAAAVARIWLAGQFDLASFGWSVIAVALFAVAYGTLYLLQSEDEP